MFNITLINNNKISINDIDLETNQKVIVNDINFSLLKNRNKTKKCDCCKTFSNKEFFVLNVDDSNIIFNNIFICQNCIKERLLIKDINNNNFTNINVLIK